LVSGVVGNGNAKLEVWKKTMMRMAVCMLCFHSEVKLLYLGGDVITKMLCCFMDLGMFRDWLLIGQLATTCRSSARFIAKEFVALESRQATYLGMA
jgi:hypothetical protein